MLRTLLVLAFCASAIRADDPPRTAEEIEKKIAELQAKLKDLKAEPKKPLSGRIPSIFGSNRGNRSCHSSSDGRWPNSFRVVTSA